MGFPGTRACADHITVNLKWLLIFADLSWRLMVAWNGVIREDGCTV